MCKEGREGDGCGPQPHPDSPNSRRKEIKIYDRLTSLLFSLPSFLSIVDLVTHTMGMVGVAEGEKRGKIQFS